MRSLIKLVIVLLSFSLCNSAFSDDELNGSQIIKTKYGEFEVTNIEKSEHGKLFRIWTKKAHVLNINSYKINSYKFNIDYVEFFDDGETIAEIVVTDNNTIHCGNVTVEYTPTSFIQFYENGDIYSIITSRSHPGTDPGYIHLQNNKYLINSAYFYPDHSLYSVKFFEPCFLETPVGKIQVERATQWFGDDFLMLNSLVFYNDLSMKQVKIKGQLNIELSIGERNIKEIIIFYKSGKIKSVRLFTPEIVNTSVGDIFCKNIGFYENGEIEFITFDEALVQTNYGKYEIKTMIDFHSDGSLHVCNLSNDTKIDGHLFKKGALIGFDTSGILIGEMVFTSDKGWIPK